MELYSRILHFEKKDGWQVYSDRAALIYEKMNIIPRRASIGIFRAMVKFTERNYKKALDILQLERSEVEAKNTFIDPMTRLDFDYTEAVLQFAVGNSKDALEVMESGIAFSREKQVFYRIDHLYRLATFHSMMVYDEEKTKYYTKKIELYGELADDKEATLFAKYTEIHYLNSYQKDYEKALNLLEHYQDKFELGKFHSPFVHLEKGKALFGLNRFESALIELNQVKIADYIHHPFDLSTFYVKDAYIALCYFALGNQVKSIEHAKIAYDNISAMPDSPYKDFINETYEKIRSRH